MSHSRKGSMSRKGSFPLGGGTHTGVEPNLPVDHKFLARKQSISHNAVVTVRVKLPNEEQVALSDETIHQFLRATGGDQDLVSMCMSFWWDMSFARSSTSASRP